MITVRSIVKFISKNRDEGKFIVRELRYGDKVLIESLKGDGYYIVNIDDVGVVVGNTLVKDR